MPLEQKPYYVPRNRGVTWSVYEINAVRNVDNAILHNLKEWQARAIAAVLNQPF